MLSLIMVTHFDLGGALIRSAREILGNLPLPTMLLNVDNQQPPEQIRQQALDLIAKAPQKNPILFLTDLYGSTPHNVAESLDSDHTIKVVSGVNLPMLLRIFNYHYLPFEEVVKKAIEGAHNGIVGHTTAS